MQACPFRMGFFFILPSDIKKAPEKSDAPKAIPLILQIGAMSIF